MNTKPYILYAEDYIKNIVNIEKMLQDSFEVHFINSGQDCLESIAHRTPDLILLGDSLPLFDNDETLQLLQADSHYKEIPVILLSSKIADDEIGVSYEAEYALHEDAVDKNKLVSSINQLLSHSENIMH